MIQMLQILTVTVINYINYRFIYCDLKQLNGMYLMIT